MYDHESEISSLQNFTKQKQEKNNFNILGLVNTRIRPMYFLTGQLWLEIFKRKFVHHDPYDLAKRNKICSSFLCNEFYSCRTIDTSCKKKKKQYWMQCGEKGAFFECYK